MHILKIKSLDRPEKLLWKIPNERGLNLLIAPSGWGKTHLLESVIRYWANPSARQMDYRIEAMLGNGSMVIIGSKEQSKNSAGIIAALENGTDAIMYYPGNERRVDTGDTGKGFTFRTSCAPLRDMKVGMTKSVIVVDDADFGMDSLNAAEYLIELGRQASIRGNQVIAATSRREIAAHMPPENFTKIENGWDGIKNNLQLIMKVE